MDTRDRGGEEIEGVERTGGEDENADRDGVDCSLIRWMLSLSPAERLETLQRHVNAVLALRGEA